MLSGPCWHTHHWLLLEWCYDYDGRVKYIVGYKDASEQTTRLRLFQRVKGKLPEEVIADANQLEFFSSLDMLEALSQNERHENGRAKRKSEQSGFSDSGRSAA